MPGRAPWAAEGINEASDLSVLANNYMDKKLARDPRAVALQSATSGNWRMEMTRWSLGKLKEDTGVGTVDVANRMADYGIDPYWMSHEPWVVPEPFTPEAGEMYSKEDLDHWIAVIARIVDEAYADAGAGEVRAARPADPPDQGRRRSRIPSSWAMTWRAYWRKHGTERAVADLTRRHLPSNCGSRQRQASRPKRPLCGLSCRRSRPSSLSLSKDARSRLLKAEGGMASRRRRPARQGRARRSAQDEVAAAAARHRRGLCL